MSAAGAKVLAVRSLVTIRATVARQKTKSMMPNELWCTPRPSVISLPVPDGSVCIGGLPVTGTDHDRASAPEGTYGPDTRMVLSWAGGSGPWPVMWWRGLRWWAGSGGWGEGGGVPAGFAFGIEAGGEVVGAEFVVGLSGGQDVPDDECDTRSHMLRVNLADWRASMT